MQNPPLAQSPQKHLSNNKLTLPQLKRRFKSKELLGKAMPEKIAQAIYLPTNKFMAHRNHKNRNLTQKIKDQR